FFGVLGTIVAISGSALLALLGIGMSAQEVDATFNGAFASLLAIIFSFVAIRRLLSFPLLRTYGYVAMTFVVSFIVVAIGLKFFRIAFSSPQFFLATVLIIAMVEMFFHVHRHGAPLQIAVVPGTATLAKLPKTVRQSIKFVWLTDVPGEFNYSGVVAD